jgi:hypothetical protein
VGIKRDATIEFVRARTPRPVDEFDLDIRLATEIGGLSARQALGTFSCFGTCVGGGCGPTEGGPTCKPICLTEHPGCETEHGATCVTCETCRTRCDTCRTCGPTCQTCQTCQTQCGTCQTCGPTCGPTCQTCQTQCGTCQTCPDQCGPTDFPTCNNTRCFTCAPRCEIP